MYKNDTGPSTTHSTVAHSTIPRTSSKQNLYYNTSNNETENADPKNQLMNQVSLEENLKIQNKNLQNQINVLTGRIKVYENDNIEKIKSLTSQIKNFGVTEMNYKKQIQKLENENKYLKEQLNEMEEIFISLKKEVKSLLINHTLSNNNSKNNINNKKRSHSTNQNNKIITVPKLIVKEKENPETERRLNELVNIVKQYSKEISKLKKENLNLSNSLQTYNFQNNNSNLSTLQNDDSLLMKFSNIINNELYLITQWVETYMGDDYDKNFEVPSLFNDEESNFDNDDINYKLNNCIQFPSLKNCLEKSRIKINSLLNKNEKEYIDMKNLLKQMEFKNNQMKEEINNLRKEVLDINTKDLNLNKIKNDLQKDNKKNEDLISELKTTLIQSKNIYDKYLNNIYEVVNNEINETLKDNNFKAFHDKLLNINSGNLNNISDILSVNIDKMIEFIQNLKYDYIKQKEENLKFLNDKVNDTLKMYDK